MRTSVKVLIIVGVMAVLGISLTGFMSYNKLRTLEKESDVSWVEVEKSLQYRYDKVPELVSSVTGVIDDEDGVLERVMTAHNAASVTQLSDDLNKRVLGEQTLEFAVAQLLTLIEADADLSSNEAVTALVNELVVAEDTIEVDRERYNTSVQEFNKAVTSFPMNIWSKVFGFDELRYYGEEPETSTEIESAESAESEIGSN